MTTIPDISAFCDADTRRLAARALEKKRAGKKPSTDESRALRRFEKAADEQKRWEHYATFRKGDLENLTGRNPKQLRDLQSRYGIPTSGRTLDLGPLLTALIDWIFTHGRKIKAAEDDVTGEELKKWKAERERLKFLVESGQYVPVEEVHTVGVAVARHLRTTGEWLGKHCGREAQERLERALDNVQAELDKRLGSKPDHKRRNTR